jgi:hypothetical protein
MAHFVAVRAIDLKLYAYVPLVHMTYQTKFQSDLIRGLAITPEQMIGSSSNI